MARTIRADRVLVVDDDAMSREVLALLLGHAGYVVDTAVSGDEAVLHLGRSDELPAIVLCDIQMPGHLSGAPLAAALRELCPPATVLVAISGSGAPASSTQNFDAFLLKPFQVKDLGAILDARAAGEVPPCIPQKAYAGDTPSPVPHTAHSTSNLTMSPVPTGNVPTPPPAARMYPPPLDDRIFRQLTDAMPLQVGQMYQLCLEDVRKRIADMRQLVALGQAEPFVRQAHAIKGGCGMLGAAELYRRATELEDSGLRAAGLEGGADVNPLDELGAACDRLERILATRT